MMCLQPPVTHLTQLALIFDLCCTGSPMRDVALIKQCVGVGEIAISDHRFVLSIAAYTF